MTRFQKARHRWRRWWLVPAVYPAELPDRFRHDLGLTEGMPVHHRSARL